MALAPNATQCWSRLRVARTSYYDAEELQTLHLHFVCVDALCGRVPEHQQGCEGEYCRGVSAENAWRFVMLRGETF